MRDKRFITEHRGGSLTIKQHQKLILWACICAENVLIHFNENIDERLKDALAVARKWEKGVVSVGAARKASIEAISVANEISDPVGIAVARSIGHAAATAHMADHAIIAAYYALKASKNAGMSINEVRKWQNNRLPSEIRDLVITSRISIEKTLKI